MNLTWVFLSLLYLATSKACEISDSDSLLVVSCKSSCSVFRRDNFFWRESLRHKICIAGVTDGQQVLLSPSLTRLQLWNQTDSGWHVQQTLEIPPLTERHPQIALEGSRIFAIVTEGTSSALRVTNWETQESEILYPSANPEDTCGRHLTVSKPYVATTCSSPSGDTVVAFKLFGTEWIRFSITAIYPRISQIHLHRDRIHVFKRDHSREEINLDPPVLLFD